MKLEYSEPAVIRALGHRVLAFSLPFLAIVTVIALFRDANPVIPLPGTAFWVSLTGGGLAALALSTIARSMRAGESMRYRGLAIALAAAWPIDALFGSGTIGERFTPGFTRLLPEASLKAQWIASLDIERAFSAREALGRTTQGLRGPALIAAVKEESLLVSESRAAFSRLAFGSVFIAALFTFIATVSFLGGRIVSPLSVAAVGLFTVLSTFVFALWRSHDDGVELASMGIPPSLTREGKRLLAALAILVISAALAFLLAGDRPLVPADALARPFAHMRHHPKKNFLIVVPQAPPTDSGTDTMAIARLLAGKERPLPWALAMLYATARFAARVVAGTGIVWLIFGPILGVKPRDILTALKSFSRLRLFLTKAACLARRIRRGFGGARFRATSLHAKEARSETRKRAPRERTTRLKRQEINRIAGEFSRVVEWGEGRGFRCDQASGPLEYANTLTSRFPAIANALRTAAAILEKSLYSTRGLSESDKKAFSESIHAILTYREPSEGRERPC